MRNHLSGQLATLRLNEGGQVAILMVMVLPAIFLFFSLALDAGVWFFDHRRPRTKSMPQLWRRWSTCRPQTSVPGVGQLSRVNSSSCTR
jgi:hypothetical protein